MMDYWSQLPCMWSSHFTGIAVGINEHMYLGIVYGSGNGSITKEAIKYPGVVRELERSAPSSERTTSTGMRVQSITYIKRRCSGMSVRGKF